MAQICLLVLLNYLMCGILSLRTLCTQLASNVKLATRKYQIISRQLGSFEVLFSRPAEVSVAMASGRSLISVPVSAVNIYWILNQRPMAQMCLLVLLNYLMCGILYSMYLNVLRTLIEVEVIQSARCILFSNYAFYKVPHFDQGIIVVYICFDETFRKFINFINCRQFLNEELYF
jgi:hypothetical protein